MLKISKIKFAAPISQSEKVSFYDIASEYILTEQKFIKMLKMANSAIFWKIEACGQTVLPDRSVLIGQKLVENVKIEKCDIF